MAVQLAIEQYFEEFDVLPIDQKKETLFAYMNKKEPIAWEDFWEQWQSMTVCADCGHCICYIPDCCERCR